MSRPSSKLHATVSNSDGNTSEVIEKQYDGTVDCLYKQLLRGGIPALFQGMNAKLIQTVLTAAFTFLTYEQTLTLVGWTYGALRNKHTRERV